MTKRPEVCDKCGTKIVNDVCSCGLWLGPGDYPEYLRTFLDSFSAFAKMKQAVFSADDVAHGNFCIFFKGTHDMCQKVKELIEQEQSKDLLDE